jgi:hypothetical protein
MLIEESLIVNPRKGGSPAKESRFKEINILGLVLILI